MARDDIDKLPDFLIIGAAKAGTTSLHHYLDQHPQVCMSWPKETNFFTREDYLDRLEWYLNCFPRRPGLRGEASPTYTNFPVRRNVPERIASLVPDVKMIYIVRDPIERSESYYYHKYFNRTESRPIDQVFSEVHGPEDPYIAGSRYAMQIEQYLAFFSLSQIMIIDNRDLRVEREATMRSVCSFLGLEAAVAPEQLQREIKVRSKTIRVSRAAARVRHSAPARIGRRMLPVRVREPLYAGARRVLSPMGAVTPTGMAPETRDRVAGFFREDAARLRELTGRTFDHWSV